MDSDLQETAFIVEIDYRLGRVKKPSSDAVTAVNFIDDDNIATYYLTKVGQGGYINPEQSAPSFTNTNGDVTQAQLANSNPQVFAGPRGNTVQFRIQASQELQQSTYLFTQLGSSQSSVITSANIAGFNANDTRLAGKTTYYLDSTVRVVGANTGYRLDVPVRFVKITS